MSAGYHADRSGCTPLARNHKRGYIAPRPEPATWVGTADATAPEADAWDARQTRRTVARRHRHVAAVGMDALFVWLMAARRQTKRRTLRLADGGVFHIGAGTVSVIVDTVPLDPPALVLHINRSCGALELQPNADGVAMPPMRVDAARVLELVNQINADRCTAAIRGGKAEPPVELPPTFKSTARHVAAMRQSKFGFATLSDDAVGYPSRHNPDETLWVNRSSGACMLERTDPPLHPRDVARYVSMDEMTPQRGVEWLAENGYTAIPATLHRMARTGATNNAPRKKKPRPKR